MKKYFFTQQDVQNNASEVKGVIEKSMLSKIIGGMDGGGEDDSDGIPPPQYSDTTYMRGGKLPPLK